MIGVSLNAEKTRLVTLTDRNAVFAFLGFDFRWEPNEKTGRPYPHTTPRKKKVIEVLRAVTAKLARNRDYRSVQEAIREINPILRGWVNYFRVGNSSRAFDKVKWHVEHKVRRFAVKKLKRKGFGWSRWSSDDVYRKWGLFNDYRIRYYAAAKASGRPNGTITPT